MNLLYAGMDESNHGHYPEIFVLVISKDIEDIAKQSKLQKKRSRAEAINLLSPDSDFRHIVISQEDRDKLSSPYNVQAVVLAEFIALYSRLEKLIIDGRIMESVLDTAELLLPSGVVPPKDIVYMPDADKRFNIVNRADQIAYILFKHYTSYSGITSNRRYSETLITPNIERYAYKLMCLGKTI